MSAVASDNWFLRQSTPMASIDVNALKRKNLL